MKKTSDLLQFHRSLVDALIQIEKEETFPNYFYDAFLTGENTLYQKDIAETKRFESDWISTIESYFPSIDKITKDPKSGLRYDQEVVAIEKAKKTNSESIRHLASHTHLIKERNADGVVPKKILVTQAEIEYAIYENRFIKTLIERLFDFVNQRYNIVKSNVDSIRRKHFNLESSFDIQETHIDLNIDLRVKDSMADDSVSRQNRDLLQRIHNLLKKVNGLKVGQFMQEIKRAKPVYPPIMKTSIITKNVDYNNCYLLWLYLDRFGTLSFDVDVIEQNLTFDRYYLKNIYQTALMAVSTIYANQKELEDHYQYLDTKEYKRKGPKFVKKSLTELLTDPEPYEIQDNQINQYYLEQSRNIFKRNLDQHTEEASSYDVALRRALRDTIAVTNALYQSYFELENQEDQAYDPFSRMVQEDTESKLQEMRDKARIARIIRETKEVDYNESVRLEKRMLKAIDELDKQLVKETRKRIKDEAKRKAIEEKIKLERENAAKITKTLNEHLEAVNEIRETMAEERRQVTEQIREEAARLKEEEKELLALEKQKARDKYFLEVEKVLARQEAKKRKLAERAKKQKELEIQRLEKQKSRLNTETQKRVKRETRKIQQNTKAKIERRKKKIEKQT